MLWPALRFCIWLAPARFNLHSPLARSASAVPLRPAAAPCHQLAGVGSLYMHTRAPVDDHRSFPPRC